MVTAKKENLGRMPCPCCGEPVAVKKAIMTGTLSYQCQDADCEATGYAPAHTAAARKWLANIVTRGAPQPAPISTVPAPGPATNEPKPPAAKPARQPFSLGNL
jgi:hypothetical protein